MVFLLVASYPDSLINFRGPLLDALLDHGLSVHVIAPDLPIESNVRCLLEKRGIVVHTVPMERTGLNPISDMRTLFCLFKLMQNIKPDFFLAYTIKPVIYGALAARLSFVPNRFSLITGLGYAFTGTEKSRSLIRYLAQNLYRVALLSSNKTFFQNPDDQTLFLDFGITNSKSVTRVVNGSGVDISQYAIEDIPKQNRFLLIARLLGDKGVREYVGAARQVKKIYPEAIFSLVGWIDDNPDSIEQSELNAWISEGLIDFKGKLKDVRPAIKECSVYVLPSYREGTPRTVLEAMAMGRTIITTDAPGCRETVVDGLNGKLVAVKSEDDLADAMVKLIENPKLIKQYGIQSRRIAEDKYDVHKVNEYMLKEMGLLNEKNF